MIGPSSLFFGGVMTRGCKLLLLGPVQNSSIRYELDPAADETPIEDFEATVRVGVGFEVVTGPISVHAIGHIW
jgi:hypothetical protein